MRPRDEEKERRILASTLAIVERLGLASLSMEAVAKDAGVAIGTVYVYFESKEALLNALYLETKRAFAREVFEDAGASEPVRPAFDRMSLAYIQYVQKNRSRMLFMNQVVNSAFLYEETRKASAEVLAPIVALLERGKAEGLLKDLPTPLMIAFVHATLAELSSHVGSEPRKVQAERHAQITRLAWDALKA